MLLLLIYLNFEQPNFILNQLLFFVKKMPQKTNLLRQNLIAERMGFEPTIQLPIYKLSRLAPSTTRTPL